MEYDKSWDGTGNSSFLDYACRKVIESQRHLLNHDEPVSASVMGLVPYVSRMMGLDLDRISSRASQVSRRLDVQKSAPFPESAAMAVLIACAVKGIDAPNRYWCDSPIYSAEADEGLEMYKKAFSYTLDAEAYAKAARRFRQDPRRYGCLPNSLHNYHKTSVSCLACKEAQDEIAQKFRDFEVSSCIEELGPERALFVLSGGGLALYGAPSEVSGGTAEDDAIYYARCLEYMEALEVLWEAERQRLPREQGNVFARPLFKDLDDSARPEDAVANLACDLHMDIKAGAIAKGVPASSLT